jgi:hypothetical protein
MQKKRTSNIERPTPNVEYYVGFKNEPADSVLATQGGEY